MGEQNLLSTKEAAQYLGITAETFKRYRQPIEKNDNATLIKKLNAITKGNGHPNYYAINELKEIKKDMKVHTRKHKVVSAVEASEILGISKNTFNTYRNQPEDRPISPLGIDVRRLTKASYIALGNYYFRYEVEAIANKEYREVSKCKHCNKDFFKLKFNQVYCSKSCSTKTQYKPRPKLVAEPKKSNAFTKQLNANNRVVANTYASYSEIPKPGERCYAGRIALSPFASECLNCKLSKCEVL